MPKHSSNKWRNTDCIYFLWSVVFLYTIFTVKCPYWTPDNDVFWNLVVLNSFLHGCSESEELMEKMMKVSKGKPEKFSILHQSVCWLIGCYWQRFCIFNFSPSLVWESLGQVSQFKNGISIWAQLPVFHFKVEC